MQKVMNIFLFTFHIIFTGDFQVAQLIKNLPAIQETQEILVRFPGQENPLEEGMATHSSILAWIVPWIEEPDGLQSLGLQRVRHD